MIVTSRLKVKQIKIKSLNWLLFGVKNWVPNIFFLCDLRKRSVISTIKFKVMGFFDNVLLRSEYESLSLRLIKKITHSVWIFYKLQILNDEPYLKLLMEEALLYFPFNSLSKCPWGFFFKNLGVKHVAQIAGKKIIFLPNKIHISVFEWGLFVCFGCLKCFRCTSVPLWHYPAQGGKPLTRRSGSTVAIFRIDYVAQNW